MQWAILPGLLLLWGVVLVWRIYVERRRPDTAKVAADIGAAGILFLLTLAFFWRTLSGDVYQPADGGDLVSFLYPTYRFAASQISQWTLPLWNPHLYGGAPFIGDIQAGFLYPPNLLLFLVKPDFPYEIMQWLSIGHLYWAGLGMYVLLRILRFGDESLVRPAALLGALAFQFSDALFIHLGNLNLIAVLAWLPWVFAAYWLALERRNLLWAAVAAMLFAIGNYAGHAQSSYYIGLTLGVYTLIWLTLEIRGESMAQDDNEQRAWPRFVWERLKYLVLVGLLTVLLTAPILLPAFEMAGYTVRQDYTYQDAIGYSLSPAQAIAGLFTPGFFGRGPQLHWSLWDRVETPYVGLVTLILAILGLALAPRPTRRRLWPWVGLALFGLLVALGVYGIVHGLLYAILPGFDQFRAPARAIVIWAFAVSVMGAVGVDVLVRRWRHTESAIAEAQQPPRDRGVTIFMLVGAVVLVGLVVPILFWALLITQGDDANFLHASLAVLSAVIAGGFWLATWAVLAGYRIGWIGSTLFGGLLVALLFVELAATGAYTDISSSDPTRGYQHDEIVEFLRADPDLFRIDARTDIDDLWQPDSAALHGLFDVWGVANPLLLSHWNDLWESTGGRHTANYDMLNAKYVLVRDGTPLPEDKFELALDAEGDLSLYRNIDVLPRAWLVHEVAELPAEPSQWVPLNTLLADPEFDPGSTVLLESLPGGEFTVESATAAESSEIVQYGSGAIQLDVDASASAMLVLSEVWYPGWRAMVNGSEVDVRRANGALRAVPVPAGNSQVTLHFAPTSWRIGLAAFAIGMIVVIGLVVLTLTKARNSEN